MGERIQDWNRYTRDDHAVWGILARRQGANLRGRAWDRYLGCLEQAGLVRDRVPNFEDVDRALRVTGWSIEVVDGIIPIEEFVDLLSRRRFPSSTWLRSRAQLDYLEEPDMFHDVFGHMPLLLDRSFADYVQQFGAMGCRWAGDWRARLLLERLYWFTIEFGCIRHGADLRILGAGLLSSFGETNHLFGGTVELGPFSVEGALYQPFRNNEVQSRYYIVEHEEDLWRSLPRAAEIIADLVAGRRATEPFRFDEQVGSGSVTTSGIAGDR